MAGAEKKRAEKTHHTLLKNKSESSEKTQGSKKQKRKLLLWRAHQGATRPQYTMEFFPQKKYKKKKKYQFYLNFRKIVDFKVDPKTLKKSF